MSWCPLQAKFPQGAGLSVGHQTSCYSFLTVKTKLYVHCDSGKNAREIEKKKPTPTHDDNSDPGSITERPTHEISPQCSHAAIASRTLHGGGSLATSEESFVLFSQAKLLMNMHVYSTMFTCAIYSTVLD